MTSVIFLLAAFLFSGVVATDKVLVNRPRGVPLSRKSLYDSSKDFTCFDGSLTIPFDQVNDDYCDCKDGSDEPGTSACPNGRFTCVNLGHKPMEIPSGRVNDQLCDCCDGSDEFSGVVQCPNICDELGKQAREEHEKRTAITKEGFAKRQEMAKEGQKLRQEMQTKLESLKKDRDALQPERDQLETKKQEAERVEKEAKDKHRELHSRSFYSRSQPTQAEQYRNSPNKYYELKEEKKRQQATEAFETIDVDNNKKVTLTEMRARTEFDTDLDGEVSDEEAKDHLGGKEEVELQQFIDDVWKNIKSVYRPAGGSLEPPPPTPDPRASDSNVPPPDQGQKEALDEKDVGDPETEGEEEIEGDETENFDADKSEKDTYRPPRDFDSDGEELPPYEEATQKLIDDAEAARKEFNDVDSKYREIETSISNSETFMEMDFGADSEWAALRNKCFELTDAQYIYKLCLFEKSTQKDKNSHSETSLGNWQKWEGPEEDKYAKQKYDKGQSCWNGPERSTEVILRCGVDTQLIEATEPGRCEYRFVLETPVACKDPATLVRDEHTEL